MTLSIKYYDLGSEYRDPTDDPVTVGTANAIRQYGVAVNCVAITPDAARPPKFDLKRIY